MRFYLNYVSLLAPSVSAVLYGNLDKNSISISPNVSNDSNHYIGVRFSSTVILLLYITVLYMYVLQLTDTVLY